MRPFLVSHIPAVIVFCGMVGGGARRTTKGLCFQNWFLLRAHMSSCQPEEGWAGLAGPWGPFSEFLAPKRQAKLNLGQMAGGRRLHAEDVWLLKEGCFSSRQAGSPKLTFLSWVLTAGNFLQRALCEGGAGLLGQKLLQAAWICNFCSLLWRGKNSKSLPRLCPRKSWEFGDRDFSDRHSSPLGFHWLLLPGSWWVRPVLALNWEQLSGK